MNHQHNAKGAVLERIAKAVPQPESAVSQQSVREAEPEAGRRGVFSRVRAMTRTAISIRSIEAIDEAMLRKMWALYAPHHNMDWQQFVERLATLDEVALFTCRSDGALIGFCGLRHRTVSLANGKRAATFYVGVSFVDRQWRSNGLIQRMAVRRMVGPLLSPQYHRVYFWADCLTYRPYLLMTRNLREYYPSRARVAPDEVREVVTTLGRAYYGDAFDEERGTVRKQGRRIKQHEAVVSAEDLQDPDILFYMQRNRDYRRGDGLIAICPMGLRNLAYLMRRHVFKRCGTPRVSSAGGTGTHQAA